MRTTCQPEQSATMVIELRFGKSYMIKLLNIESNHALQLKIAYAINYEMRALV